MTTKSYLLIIGLLLAWWGCNSEAGQATMFELAGVEPYTATFNLKIPDGMDARVLRQPQVKGYPADTLDVRGDAVFSAGLYLMNTEWEFTLLLRPSGSNQWQINKAIRLNNRFPAHKFRRVNPRVTTDTVISILDVLPFTVANIPSCNLLSAGWQPETVVHTEAEPTAWHLRLHSESENKYYHFIIRQPNHPVVNFIMRSNDTGVFLARPQNLFCYTTLTQPNPDNIRNWSANGILFSVNSEWQMDISAMAGSEVRVGSCIGCDLE